MVDLPEPGGPTMPSVRPGRTSKEMSLQHLPAAGVVAEADMLEAQHAAAGAQRRAPGASAISGSRSSTSNSRPPEEVARAAELKIMAICRIGACSRVM